MKSSSQFSSRFWLLDASMFSSVNRSSYAWSFCHFFSWRSFASSSRVYASPPPSPGPSSSSSSHSGGGLPPGPGPDASLSARLKHLIKSYGWYALGVYAVLSVLDFSVAFAAINVVGAEHVARVATDVKEYFAALVHSAPPEPGREEMDRAAAHAGGHEGLMAMLVLAYTIHKTLFLPVRVGLTAAVTPKLVHWLRARGWAGSCAS